MISLDDIRNMHTYIICTELTPMSISSFPGCGCILSRSPHVNRSTSAWKAVQAAADPMLAILAAKSSPSYQQIRVQVQEILTQMQDSPARFNG